MNIAPIAACVAIAAGSDSVRVRDLFGGNDETLVALAPVPGVQRRFDMAELRRIATRLHLPEQTAEVCVERPVAPLEPSKLLDTMRAAIPDARIELIDYSRAPVPDGRLELPVKGLRQSPGGALWSGWIRYGGAHRFNVWARVRISVSTPRAVALSDLPAGQTINASDLRIEMHDGFPTATPSSMDIADVAGRIPRRTIRAGTVIQPAWLELAKAIRRGATVQVEVRQGGAVLHVAGEAQGSGSVGQTILVLNPTSGKRFPARIEGPGHLSVGGMK